MYLIGHRIFDSTNEGKGNVEFQGNILFTHFSEIKAPNMGMDLSNNH